MESLLARDGLTLPEIQRRPDMRLIVENTSGSEIQFFNPGDHSRSKPEVIPADGPRRAVMVMVSGFTLPQQLDTAKLLFAHYRLGETGLSGAFLKDLQSGSLSHPAYRLVREAYGPAPFAEESQRLTDVSWQEQGADLLTVRPCRAAHAAYGLREAVTEKAFLAEFPVFVQGSATTPEQVESDGMVIAVSVHPQTGRAATRPIVPSVAREFYGPEYEKLPVVTVDPDGAVLEVCINTRKLAASRGASCLYRHRKRRSQGLRLDF